MRGRKHSGLRVVHVNGNGTKGVSYEALVAPLIGAVKELEAANDDLVSDSTALQAENHQLRPTVETQSRRLERVERMLEAVGR